MIQLKSCSRCSGDVSIESDMYGHYNLCLQCGSTTYPLVAEDVRLKNLEVLRVLSDSQPIRKGAPRGSRKHNLN